MQIFAATKESSFVLLASLEKEDHIVIGIIMFVNFRHHSFKRIIFPKKQIWVQLTKRKQKQLEIN